MLTGPTNEDHQVGDVLPQNLMLGTFGYFYIFYFLVIDDIYSFFTAPLRGVCALQNQDPGQWNDLEAFFDTFLFKSNLHLFVDVVEDVANSWESRSTIGIKHRWSYNLRKRFVFSVKMILVLFFNIMYVLQGRQVRTIEEGGPTN